MEHVSGGEHVAFCGASMDVIYQDGRTMLSVCGTPRVRSDMTLLLTRKSWCGVFICWSAFFIPPCCPYQHLLFFFLFLAYYDTHDHCIQSRQTFRERLVRYSIYTG
jgi:hypothetical protein